jgi:2-oxoacid:acceptor oxidoreductase gamma subunit (pyruvate/2-ketoisovalerate family)
VVYLREIRWHGRGGQGAWTASELLARAAIKEGKYIQSFPEFGPERMGAPVKAFTRISEDPINLHCAIYSPDVIAVLDPTLLKTVPVTEGLKKHGALVINTRETSAQLEKQLNFPRQHLWTISATDIAVEILGRPITNTAMLGAVARTAEIIDLKSIKEAIKERFPLKIAERNIKIVERAYEEVKLG